MATIITGECINCGACEPECPNTAIYQAGVAWDLDGATHPALSDEFFYIVPEKCTECVGFYDHEACAAVCPVDCCIPDPDRTESEQLLLERAKVLHPETAFGDDFPSRFRADNTAGDSAAGPAPAATSPDRPSTTAATPPPAAVTAAPPAAAPTPPPAAVTAAPTAAAVTPPPPAAAVTAAPKVAAATPQPAAAAVTAAPTAGAATAAPASVPEAGAVGPQGDDEAIPIPPMAQWEIPLECFRCQGGFTVPGQYLRAGTVFNCPHCHGSFIPTIQLCQAVEEALRRFRSTYSRRADEFHAQRQRELEQFRAEQRQHLEAFGQRLRELSKNVRAPGAPHRKRAFLGLG